MRNRISCSAQELGQLDPAMVESVVGGQVFKIGEQYFSDSRVNILQADGAQVVAEVNGTYGVYSQSIKLRTGMLSTKCSCPSTEQPFCRHCVAVLLHQFHNGSSLSSTPKATAPPSPSPTPEPKKVDAPPPEPAPTVDLNFREASLFIDWFQQAIGHLGKEVSLPTVPESLGGVAREWAGAIDRLNQQFLESDEDRTDAQKNVQSAEAMVDSLTKELEEVKGEFDAARQTCQRLETKVQHLEDSVKDLSQVSAERDRLVSKVSTMQSELQKKGAELESVSMTLKSLSKAIRNMLPSDSS